MEGISLAVEQPGADPDGAAGISVAGTPDRRLRGIVRGYVGYAHRFPGVARQLEPPTGGAVLIVGLGPALRVIDPRRPGAAAEHRGGFVAGLHDGPVTTEAAGEIGVVQASLTPIGARLVLGVPMDGIANRTVALDDLLGGAGRMLVERIQEAPNWPARFRLLDEALIARLTGAPAPAPEIAWAWRQLVASGGTLPVGALADELGWSQKRLLAGFRREVGLPPKVLARVVRFRRAVAVMDRAGDARWAEVAQACGYFDQAHLGRDVRRFTGMAPGAFLDQEIAARGRPRTGEPHAAGTPLPASG